MRLELLICSVLLLTYNQVGPNGLNAYASEEGFE